MPFEIVRNDITDMCVDAVVNTANPQPIIGAGVDSAIHKKAGPKLLATRQKIGDIACGHAAITPAFDLQAKFVIHTVGPIWRDGNHGEAGQLYNCYMNSLNLARENHCNSIAFPLIATGNYGFPKEKALQIAINAFSSFLMEHEMQIYLVVFDRASFRLSEKLFQSVASYIDENYVDARVRTGRSRGENQCCIWPARIREFELHESDRLSENMLRWAAEEMPCSDSKAPTFSLEDILMEEDAGFTETLLKLIDDIGKKDSEIYKKANISKQHFSKIRNNPNYRPTKPTAIAFALALELDLEKTKDLIGRAGYALTNSSKFDLIIRYFIERGNFNVMEINLTLYEFDQTLLGS